ncbi:hypothetical protein SCHPADRAFT_915601 [Schizopora paradoxa]|uniref:DUF6570 domain-containing protein n=1 Tax=Schizopora paradoxa TaxID=27342 RepID=A0A0H2S6W0_9AGAM|nr:hypothetical protein SCHPADRAFT_915601 [Schizopora paradoxa]
MIARRRAKCWIIHLKGDKESDEDNKGFRGHVIVYPQRPEELRRVFPPPIEDVITPMCVVFIGSSPPTREWLRTKAYPLIIRREKVRNALEWLKIHNPLYSDIEIDYETLHALPDRDVAPVEVTVEENSEAIDSIGSKYDSYTNGGEDEETVDVFRSAIVSDLEGKDLSRNMMSIAALRHLKRGGGFVQIPHGRTPSDEYDPDLFPLMYPSLFPYGCGGFDDCRGEKYLNYLIYCREGRYAWERNSKSVSRDFNNLPLICKDCPYRRYHLYSAD